MPLNRKSRRTAACWKSRRIDSTSRPVPFRRRSAHAAEWARLAARRRHHRPRRRALSHRFGFLKLYFLDFTTSQFKVERLQSKQKELRSHLDGFLTDFMSQIFSGLFVHRYRDCRAEIRSICIQELGMICSLFCSNCLLLYWSEICGVTSIYLNAKTI